MIGRLLIAVDRLPEWARRGLVIVFPLLLLGVLVPAFALAPAHGGLPGHRPTTADHLLPPEPSHPPARTALGQPSSLSSASTPATTPGLVVDPDRPLVRASPLRGMLATASSFANGYVLYEIGRLPRWVRRVIVQTCAPTFARYLLGRPALLAGLYAAHPRHVEVDRVVSVSFAGGRTVEVSYVAAQNSADSGAFFVKLVRARERWLVASVGL